MSLYLVIALVLLFALMVVLVTGFKRRRLLFAGLFSLAFFRVTCN